ncbi:MAG: peptidoglycan editing factor PgeF [Betaproteobacteria bacterium]|nr:peptidoglycan editing factor PgeF [Betaproteobacteria bacterium]
MPEPDLIVPDWPAPACVRSFVTTRSGGVSTGRYASLNLGTRGGDDAAAVRENRARVRELLPAEPRWMHQVHGTQVIDATSAPAELVADAAVATARRVVCTVLTADCMPVLIADAAGRAVGIAHAGWRGLACGIIESTLDALGGGADERIAWLGPAIGPQAYEVGDEVRAAFLARDRAAESAFRAARPGHWMLDLYAVARQRLAARGVRRVFGGNFCTYRERERFFSFRRDGASGRMASMIWLE